jgi:hypothetical protein
MAAQGLHRVALPLAPFHRSFRRLVVHARGAALVSVAPFVSSMISSIEAAVDSTGQVQLTSPTVPEAHRASSVGSPRAAA